MKYIFVLGLFCLTSLAIGATILNAETPTKTEAAEEEVARSERRAPFYHDHDSSSSEEHGFDHHKHHGNGHYGHHRYGHKHHGFGHRDHHYGHHNHHNGYGHHDYHHGYGHHDNEHYGHHRGYGHHDRHHGYGHHDYDGHHDHHHGFGHHDYDGHNDHHHGYGHYKHGYKNEYERKSYYEPEYKSEYGHQEYKKDYEPEYKKSEYGNDKKDDYSTSYGLEVKEYKTPEYNNEYQQNYQNEYEHKQNGYNNQYENQHQTYKLYDEYTLGKQQFKEHKEGHEKQADVQESKAHEETANPKTLWDTLHNAIGSKSVHASAPGWNDNSVQAPLIIHQSENGIIEENSGKKTHELAQHNVVVKTIAHHNVWPPQ